MLTTTMTTLADLEKIRPCGRLETYSTARHHLGVYKNVGFTATYYTSEVGPLSLEPIVFAALRHVINEHPVLSAIALNEDKSFPNVYFARLPEIDLRTCVQIRERIQQIPKDGERDEDLDALLPEQHSRGFQEDAGLKPFWRIVVLKSPSQQNTFTLSWFFHHALADGVSAFLFHEAFLAGLEAHTSDRDASPIVIPPQSSLVPPLEDLHPMIISWPFFLAAILAALLPSIFGQRPTKLWTGAPVPTTINVIPQPQYHTVVLSTEITKRLMHMARNEKTSITAVLQCLVAATLFASLPSEKYEKLKIDGPISIRRFLDLDHAQNRMTNAITQYSFEHVRTYPQSESNSNSALHQFSWDEARAVKASIVSEVAKMGNNNPIALLRYVSDMPKYFMEKLGQPRNPSVEISNVGRWRGGVDGNAKWRVGRMVFSQSPNVTSCAFAVNVITGGDGNLVLNFSWCEGAVEEGFLNKVIGNIARALRELTSTAQA